MDHSINTSRHTLMEVLICTLVSHLSCLFFEIDSTTPDLFEATNSATRHIKVKFTASAFLFLPYELLLPFFQKKSNVEKKIIPTFS